jgi:hypothetical protein
MLNSKQEQTKQWLKSMKSKAANISPGTLQNLRINGTISYTKIEVYCITQCRLK